ncbi:MAG: YeeE/YedE thiosulfate transporter family protein [Thermoanaerobaculia bacterium]
MSAILPFAATTGWASLALAAGIGIAFGVALECAGLGSAKKLAGQFYLTDFTVFKVMFSAILTALLGIELMVLAGWVDPTRLPLPATYVAPQLVGGAVFGVGFVLGGLCPGTACVAAASARGDGFAAVAGLFGGILATGLLFAPLAPFYESGGRGAYRLPEALGWSEGAVVAGVVVLAAAGFAAAEWLERRRGRPTGR